MLEMERESECGERDRKQRTLNIGGSITVWLTFCLTGLDLTKPVKQLLIQHRKSI